MPLIVFVFICVALIIVGVQSPKPGGWVVLTLSVLALLFAVLGPHWFK